MSNDTMSFTFDHDRLRNGATGRYASLAGGRDLAKAERLARLGLVKLERVDGATIGYGQYTVTHRTTYKVTVI